MFRYLAARGKGWCRAVLIARGGGVRPGWRVLVFAALCVGLGAVIFWLDGRLVALQGIVGLPVTVLAIVYAATPAFAALGATALAGRLDGTGFSAHGLGGDAVTARMAAGWGAGFVLLSLLIGLIAALGGARVAPPAGSVLPLLGSGLWQIVRYGLVGLFEETAFRGYVLHTLWRGWGFPTAAVVTSLLFGAAHLVDGGENLFGALCACLIGYALCLSIRRTGALWWAIGFHAGWDWAESFCWGAPDSGQRDADHLFEFDPVAGSWIGGGGVGPEGSPLVLSVIGLTIALILTRLRHRPATQVV